MINQKKITKILLILSFFILVNCGVKDAIDDSIDAVECANLIQRIEDDGDNQTCAEQIADINKILNTCNEFLSQEQRDNLNFIKENCVDN